MAGEKTGPVEDDPYPSQIAMEAAVHLEVEHCLGLTTTVVVGKVIQRAIDTALASAKGAIK